MQAPHTGETAPYARRGHTPQISISDESHHVTEAIGGMYGSDDDDYLSPAKRMSRPLSFIGSPAEAYDTTSYFDTKRASPPRTPLSQTGSNEKLPPYQDSPSLPRKGSPGSENVPLSRKSSTDTAVQQFPLNDIDYESSPAAVAQELSNLQAIRRMSMNVDTADPDLPSFPSGSPSSPEDEDDASRLFWVPARLHPELAPKEFKTFVEDRVDRIRSRSGSGDSLSLGLDRSDSGGLKRKKSMLSRQIDSSKGYEDGAERLQRKRSEGGHSHLEPTVENLQELEGLVGNINLDASRTSLDSGVEVSGEDMPIMPSSGPTLKRSTRTYMRKDRGPYSKRALSRQSEDSDHPRAPSPAISITEHPSPSLTRVSTEPSQNTPPSRDVTARLTSASSDNLAASSQHQEEPQQHQETSQKPPRSKFHSRIASNGRTTAPLPGYNSSVSQIVETPPASPSNTYSVPERTSSHAAPPSTLTQQHASPQLHVIPQQHAPSQQHASSQHHTSPQQQHGKSQQHGSSRVRGAHTRPAPRPALTSTSRAPSSTLDDISSNPSPLPGSGGMRTDALTAVPTYEEKRSDKKDNRKTSWNWLLGGDEKDREKEREKERKTEEKEREKEASKKSKSSLKLAKTSDKTRLDVLQSSIDGSPSPRGRESLVLDRESIRLEEERKKESTRRSADGKDGKKEKDSGILSAIFGGGKRSKQHNQHTPKETSRALSPEPPPRILRPDIDYNWTRFSILEERAIYRMAHIKLANPRRALHSQVLLSNFMYSYLAKVQLYHPQQNQVPAAQKAAQAKQQQQQQGAARGEEGQGEDHNKYQKWQEQRRTTGDAAGGADQQALESAKQATQQGQRQDYLGYSTDEQPFDQNTLWQDEESSDLW